MRRILPAALQTVPSKEWKTDRSFSVKLELECVTPLIGGGVESYVPDTVDYVRVPGIRGRLREFWRALEPAPRDSNSLFRGEICLWGGVTPDDIGSGKSRVEIRVHVPRKNRGREYPAGWHEPRRNGGFSALPKWRDPTLSYGCFPLQQPRKALDAAGGRMPRVGTRNLREGLRFQIELRLAPAKELTDADTRIVEANRLLGSLFCWVYLGGLGGRTTRGFGALRVCGQVDIQSNGIEPEYTEKWIELFAGPRKAETAEQWLRKGLALAGIGDCTESSEAPPGSQEQPWHFEWPTLHGAKIYAGPPQATADAAHGMLLRALQTFRQGEGVGRNPGQGTGRPGQSRWPEANLLKRKRDEVAKSKREWEHPPPEFSGNASAPRAAFGLPIVVSFKDEKDFPANATLEAAGNGGGRWTSPVRLRPVLCADGRWVPLVVALDRRPDEVKIAFKTPTKTAHESSPHVSVCGLNSGAQPPIAGYLDKNGGDAVDAFLDWLVTERRFVGSRGGR